MIQTVAIFPATVRPLDADASLPDASVEGHTFAERFAKATLRTRCSEAVVRHCIGRWSHWSSASFYTIITIGGSIERAAWETKSRRRFSRCVASYDESLEFHPETVRLQASRNFAETTLRNHRLMRKILEREICDICAGLWTHGRQGHDCCLDHDFWSVKPWFFCRFTQETVINSLGSHVKPPSFWCFSPWRTPTGPTGEALRDGFVAVLQNLERETCIDASVAAAVIRRNNAVGVGGVNVFFYMGLSENRVYSQL